MRTRQRSWFERQSYLLSRYKTFKKPIVRMNESNLIDSREITSNESTKEAIEYDSWASSSLFCFLIYSYLIQLYIPENCQHNKYFRMPKSQLQFKVLNSYKQLLKASANRPTIQNRVRNEFRQNKSIKRMELQLIEHKLRFVKPWRIIFW